MKSPAVSEFQPNQTVTTVLLVHSKEIRQKKNGEPYLSMVLGDRTGEIDSKMWDNVAEVMDTFEAGDFIKLRGQPTVYNNRLQFTVHKLIKVDEREIDLALFFPASKRDPEEMFSELTAIVSGISNSHLKALLEAVFRDAEVARKYRRAPAAKSIHHAYLSGLLEHVLSLCRLCRLVAPLYEGVDLDLLLTGAMLHDIGKIDELTYERGFSYSNEGQLVGHIAIGLRIVNEKARQVRDFPPHLLHLVEHMLLSHHGKLEFGSPKVPLFREALMLHYLDDLDSKMECMRHLLEHDRKVESDWTSYSASLERPVLKKDRYMGAVGEENGDSGVLTPEPAGTSGLSSRVAQGGRPPRPMSLFGERLHSALQDEEE